MVSDEGRDFYCGLGQTAFSRILEGVRGTTPSVILSDDVIRSAIDSLQSPEQSERIHACQLLGSASIQLAQKYNGSIITEFLDLLVKILMNQNDDVDVRGAVINCLAEYGAAYEWLRIRESQWAMARLLDMMEREESDLDLKEKFRKAHSRFTFLEATPSRSKAG